MKNTVAAVVCAAVAACSGPSTSAGGGGAGSCTLAIEWGLGEGASFVQLRDGDVVPVATDPHGVCFIDSTLKLAGTSAGTATLDVTITADGYQPDEQLGRQLTPSADGDGALYVGGLRLNMADVSDQNMAGRRALVMLVAHADGCDAWTAAAVQLAPVSP